MDLSTKKFTRVTPFWKVLSRGTMDDIPNYPCKTLREAYDTNNYRQLNLVEDENKILWIETRNMRTGEKEYKLFNEDHVFGWLHGYEERFEKEKGKGLKLK